MHVLRNAIADDPSTDNARAPRRPKLTGIAADKEKALRQITNHQRYNNFLEEADMRRMKRQDLAARNKIWEESRDQAWARINVIDQEKKKLLEQINAMHAAKQAYNAGNAVAVSEESDVETKRKWEAFFNLETNVLDV